MMTVKKGNELYIVDDTRSLELDNRIHDIECITKQIKYGIRASVLQTETIDQLMFNLDDSLSGLYDFYVDKIKEDINEKDTNGE